uniref:Small ribosomal subunit protein mS23 n=1 Tax=Hemiselmis andersenii TaxID=464988 RepID=A0A6U2E2T1_HEMAN|mmetsp:Transcript_26890/g.62280  ORF Transcript_26890/g.62280 Transcript_26890/m.62280 type:complete len:237 (+) Transcript_26890:131-841(+)
MGKYNNLMRFARKATPAINVVEKWEKLIRAKAVPEPPFWQAIKAAPPYRRPFNHGGKLQEITFPEDRLMKLYRKRNPDWKDEVFKRHRRAAEADERTRGDMFVTQWQKYMEGGLQQEEAYSKVDSEFRAMEGKSKEKKLQAEADLIVKGKHPEFEKWLEEEEKYVQEAYELHRLTWEAERRAARVAEDVRKEQEALAASEVATEKAKKPLTRRQYVAKMVAEKEAADAAAKAQEDK